MKIKRMFLIAIAMLLAESGLYGLVVKVDGEFRTRFCYFINKDMDFTRNADFGGLDSRARFKMEFGADSPFYLTSQVEIGNINWGSIGDGGAQGADAVNLEMKNLFAGYRSQIFKAKLGIFGFSTPFKAEIDDDLIGLSLKLNMPEYEIQAVYSCLFSGTNEARNSEDNSSFELNNLDDAHFVYLEGLYLMDFMKLYGWYAGFFDSRYAYKTVLHWVGVFHQFNWEIFNTDLGFSYNFGSVDSTSRIPVSAYFAYGHIKIDLFSIVKPFLRVNLASGNNGNIDAINQFQTINGKGALKTDLGLLFGGSSFNQQAYFDNKVSTLLSRKNLTRGKIHFDDPGMLVIEVGVEKNFKEIGYATEVVFGYAQTLNSVTNRYTLGYELDWHNSLELSKETTVYVSLGALLPGNALRNAFNLNSETVLLGSQPAFKIDGMVEIKF